MSESEEDSTSISKQKSIFSGMTRVKQIHHLREKWSPKSKSPLPDRTFVDTPPSSPWSRRASPAKYALGQTPGPYRDSGRPTTRRTQSMNGSPRGQPMITIVDMERYLAINTWLENNDINVAQIDASRDETRTKSKSYGLFDDMYSSLDVLEKNLKSELSHLRINEKTEEDTRSNEQKYQEERKDTPESSPPALFDYLVVIGADMLDVKIRNFWNQKENVYESTIVFAHPPESQFNAESLEHFCFPTGVKTINLTTPNCDRSNEIADENSQSKEDDFFVLMLSGGGVHGQSVQYAMCMKGTITIRGTDGKDLLLPMCYCIVAQIPLVPFFRALLQGFLDNLRKEFEPSANSECSPLSSIVTDKHAGYVDDILQTLKKIPLPDKGLSVSVEVFPLPSPELILARPHKENDMDEKVALLLQWALPSLLSRLSIDRLLQILSLLLVEVKLIVVSDEILLLSSATLGLASLLHPLTWAGPLISVLPPSMHEYMEAPVPLICGVDELPRDFECSKGICILYLAENRVQLHVEDEHSLGKLQMPELESLSCDLTRFTKQMLGRVTGSFRDNVTPLSTHLVIHHVRRHIEHLITVCSHVREQYRNLEADYQLDANEIRFVDAFMQTQMYQKYQDDRPTTLSIEQSNQQQPNAVSVRDELPTKESSINKQHDELKSAASILFQIALAGVSSLPQSNSRTDNMPTPLVCEEIEVLSPDIVMLPTSDEPEPGSVKLLSAASSPSARFFSNIKNNYSPHEKAESPSRGYELLSPTVSEASVHSDRRPNRTFVWPLSQSELDVFWVSDEASPGSFVLHSSRSETFESPRRSANNESDASYFDFPKSVDRSEHGSLVNAQRTDTEMTISIFDTASSEALGNADTVDAWLFEPSDDPRRRSPQNDESDEDRTTKHESSVEEDYTPVHNESESFYRESVTEQNSSFANAGRSWLVEHDNGLAENYKSNDGVLLTLEQVKTLTAGVNIASRGAWDGWCEGKMFVSPDFSTLIWERRAVAFAAFNMNIRDITSVSFEDRETTSPTRPLQRRIQLNFSVDVIYFQFSRSSLHDRFFEALQQLLRSTMDNEDRQRSSRSPPHFPSLDTSNEYRHDLIDTYEDTKTTDVIQVRSFVAHLETDIHLFKQKLQRGFLVEKHGRLGKPHAKILFTDALCSHIMWRKPHINSAASGDQHNVHHQLQGRSRLFSQDKSIPVDSITAIVTGKQTTVFRRAAAIKSNDQACLSILTPTRTLDICAHSLESFQELYRGFSLLLAEIKRTREGLD